MKGLISSPACAWLNSQCYSFINGSSQLIHCGSNTPYTASHRPVSSSLLCFSVSLSSLARQSGVCGTSLWTQNAMSFEMFISLILLWSSRLISPLWQFRCDLYWICTQTLRRKGPSLVYFCSEACQCPPSLNGKLHFNWLTFPISVCVINLIKLPYLARNPGPDPLCESNTAH